MVCEKNVNDWEYNQLVQLIKAKYTVFTGILVFPAAYKQQLVKFLFLPQREVWKGHIGDSELANKPAS